MQIQSEASSDVDFVTHLFQDERRHGRQMRAESTVRDVNSINKQKKNNNTRFPDTQ